LKKYKKYKLFLLVEAGYAVIALMAV